MSPSAFRIRSHLSHPEDTEFLVHAFDSCVTHCESIGSVGMWGTQPFSAKDGFVKETEADVLNAEKYRTAGTGDAVLILIAEKETTAIGSTPAEVDAREDDDLCYRDSEGEEEDGGGRRRYLKLGAAMVKLNWFPGYIKKQSHIQGLLSEAEERGDWAYIEVMISDFRTSSAARQGVGAALLEGIRDSALEKGAKTLFVDAWSGNGGKLVKFYESKGFVRVDDYVLERKNKDPWPGVLLQMDLAQAPPPS